MLERLKSFWEGTKETVLWVYESFSTTLFKLGQSEITLGTIIYLIVAFFLLSFLSARLKKILTKTLQKQHPEKGFGANIGLIVRFIVLFIGSIIIIQSAGIDLSSLGLIAGALGVGVGFGLQNITDNFISGIIILFEQPIKVGDRIEVGDISGDVMNISGRATTILTNDNISMIVPNSEFISKQVINWSHNDRNVRFKIPVGVSYNEDPIEVKRILLEAAEENEDVLNDPAPMVIFDEFADSSLNFYLAVWTNTFTDRPMILKSNLYFAIFEKFKKEGIEIPFPQRDIHIKSSDDQAAASALTDGSMPA